MDSNSDQPARFTGDAFACLPRQAEKRSDNPCCISGPRVSAPPSMIASRPERLNLPGISLPAVSADPYNPPPHPCRWTSTPRRSHAVSIPARPPGRFAAVLGSRLLPAASPDLRAPGNGPAAAAERLGLRSVRGQPGGTGDRRRAAPRVPAALVRGTAEPFGLGWSLRAAALITLHPLSWSPDSRLVPGRRGRQVGFAERSFQGYDASSQPVQPSRWDGVGCRQHPDRRVFRRPPRRRHRLALGSPS